MPAGQPTKYKSQYASQAYKLALLGATNEKLADFFEVHGDTIAEWINVQPEFSDALKEGRDLADAKVSESLYNRAIGYSHKAVKMQLDRTGKWQTMEYTEQYPPDTLAAIFWLKNRQPDRWREKSEVLNKTITVTVADEEE